MNDVPQSEPELSDAEIAKRRDEVIRRMLNTPPTPKPAKVESTVRRMANTKPLKPKKERLKPRLNSQKAP